MRSLCEHTGAMKVADLLMSQAVRSFVSLSRLQYMFTFKGAAPVTNQQRLLLSDCHQLGTVGGTG